MVIGGIGANSITIGAGNSVVFGNDGSLTYAAGVLSLAQTTDPSYGSASTISIGAGNATVFGGAGNDSIGTGIGSSIVLGQDGSVSYASGVLTAIASTDVVTSGSTSTTYSGNKTISVGAGNNIVIAGIGANTITAGNGANIVIGHEGTVSYDAQGRVASVQTQSPSYGGADKITLGTGNNTVLGGVGADSISGGAGNDIVIGHNGSVTYAAGVLTSIQSNTPTSGGNDTISLGAGNDDVIAGVGTTSITIGAGNSVVFGGDAIFTFVNGQISTAQTQDVTHISNDTIVVGIGKSTINAVGGVDRITVGSGGSVVTAATTKWQMAAAPAPASQGAVSALTESELAPIVAEAELLWTQALGANAPQLAILNDVIVQIGQLPSGMLGATQGETITIDATAAGWGWFIDANPTDSSAFQATGEAGVMVAAGGSAAAGQMDLLSTVLHELGNAMGFAEDLGPDVTGAVLAAGTRRLPMALCNAGPNLGPVSLGAVDTVGAGLADIPCATAQYVNLNLVGHIVTSGGQVSEVSAGSDETSQAAAVTVSGVVVDSMPTEGGPTQQGMLPGHLAFSANPAGMGVNESLNDIAPPSPNDAVATAAGDLSVTDGSAWQVADIGQATGSDAALPVERRLSVIAWNGDALPQVIRPASDHSAWLGSFLDNIGQDRMQPNANIRIKASA